MSAPLASSASPPATTETDIYRVPDGKIGWLSAVAICNTAGADATIRLAIAVGGGVSSKSAYVLYDMALPSTKTITFPGTATPIGLPAGTVIRGWASRTDIAFNVLGYTEPMS